MPQWLPVIPQVCEYHYKDHEPRKVVVSNTIIILCSEVGYSPSSYILLVTCKQLTWTKRSCEGNALLPIFKKSRNICDIIGTGPSSCSVYCIRTRPFTTTTLNVENKQ